MTNFEFLKMVHQKPRNGKICFWFDKKYPWLTGKEGLIWPVFKSNTYEVPCMLPVGPQ